MLHFDSDITAMIVTFSVAEGRQELGTQARGPAQDQLAGARLLSTDSNAPNGIFITSAIAMRKAGKRIPKINY